ncbi:MAG: peptidase family [Actinomycetia bacterium]|nr:peptidase family [Actinomycetes bacterium]
MGRGRFGGWHRRALVCAAAAVIVGSAVVGIDAPAHAVSDAQVAAAQRNLDAARTRAHDAVRAYRASRKALATIEADLADVESRLPAARLRVRTAKALLNENAVALYVGGPSSVQIAQGLFHAQGAMDIGRLTTFMSSTTAIASDSFDELRSAQRILETHERDARNRRARQNILIAEMHRNATQLVDEIHGAAVDLRRVVAQQDVERYAAAVATADAQFQGAVAAATAASTPPPTLGRRSGAADPNDAVAIPVETSSCPVAAPVRFTDDYAQPRSGFRVHEGTDIFAARGAPNVAVADGVAVKEAGGLGGNGIRLIADDGSGYYYYAHLDSYASGFSSAGKLHVKQGDTIGYSGNTGNAAGGPVHTHFQIHPHGKAPWNPYHALFEMCAAQLRASTSHPALQKHSD